MSVFCGINLVYNEGSKENRTMKLLRNWWVQVLLQVPSDCPFARTLQMGKIKIIIPPLCKLNPFYDNIMRAKMWALQKDWDLTHS